MKEWPNKILIASKAGFDKFKQDATEYVESNDIISEAIKTPDSYPCLVVGNVFSWEENDGRCHWTERELRLTYVYTTDFN